MINDLLHQAQADFAKVLEHLKAEYSALQIGRASAPLVENLMVEAYGSTQPLKAVAGISIPDAKTIQIQPWDKSLLKPIEQSIQNSDLSLAPLNDGITIRLNIPPLTEERRRDLTKLVHRMAEDARIAVRHARQKVHDKARDLQKNSEITEDEFRSFDKQLQEKIDTINKGIEEAAKSKEADVMKV